MSGAFASGRNALAICDQCGKSLKYLGLKENVSAQKRTGLLVCEECNDKDHPQLMLGRFKINDPISLRNARPDWPNTQGVAGFNPLTGMNIDFRVGGAFVSFPVVTDTAAEKIGFSISGVGLYIKIASGSVEAGAEWGPP